MRTSSCGKGTWPGVWELGAWEPGPGTQTVTAAGVVCKQKHRCGVSCKLCFPLSRHSLHFKTVELYSQTYQPPSPVHMGMDCLGR